MRGRKTLHYVVVALCLLAAFVLTGARLGLLGASANGAEAVRVRRQEFSKGLELDGALACENQRTLYATLPGRVNTIYAGSGETLEPDQLILAFDGTAQTAALRAALFAASASRESAAALASRLEALDAPDLAALAPIFMKTVDANAAVEAALAVLELTRLRSPESAALVRLHVSPDQVVAAGAPLCEIGGEKRVVRVPLSDADAARVTPGQRVLVKRDGGEVGMGTIARVEPQGEQVSYGAASLLLGDQRQPFAYATVTLDEPLDLPVGSALSCFILFSKVDAVCVPLSAIGAGDTVLVVQDEGGILRASRVPVRCGLVDGPDIQLLSGPPEGSLVMLNGALPDGVRLRGLAEVEP